MTNNNAKRLNTANEHRNYLHRLTAEFTEYCKEIADKLRAKHKWNLYRQYAIHYLSDESFKEEWNRTVEALEECSNGKFNRNLRHTWGQLGNGEYILLAYNLLNDYDTCLPEDEERIEFCLDSAFAEIIRQRG